MVERRKDLPLAVDVRVDQGPVLFATVYGDIGKD